MKDELNLWEEKNLIDQKQNSLPNEENDNCGITTEIKNGLTKNELDDTSKTKNYSHKDFCKCGKTKYKFSKLCRKCHVESKRMDNYKIRNKDNCQCGNLKYKTSQCCRKCLEKFKTDSKQKRRWRTYGLNPDDVEKYISTHNGLCEICGTKPTNERQTNRKYLLDVDHDHKTGKFRGLLCPRCNRVLGSFDDSLEWLDKAKNYLQSKTFPTLGTYPDFQ